jgi:hypothetical protein
MSSCLGGGDFFFDGARMRMQSTALRRFGTGVHVGECQHVTLLAATPDFDT